METMKEEKQTSRVEEEEKQQVIEEKEEEEQEQEEEARPKRLNLNIVDDASIVGVTSYKSKTGTPITPITPQLTDIVIDNTTYRAKNRNKSLIKRCCRGFRVQITAILSVIDVWSNLFVMFLFVLRAVRDKYFIFYVWSAIIGIFMLLTSIISYRMGPATSCNKLYYCCQIGICFECQNSLNYHNEGHATYTFKLMNVLESMSRALPLSIFKLFILIWYNYKYPYWSSGNWLLIISTTFSILSYSFWFTNHIKDTLRDRFNEVFESVLPSANKYDGDYNQDPSQSIKKFKMNWFNKVIFCIFIAFDFITRCGIFFVLLRYSPSFIYSETLNYFIFPIIIIIQESLTYFLFLYCIDNIYRNDIKFQYNKLQIILMIIGSIITVTPFYNDSVVLNINYKKKLFVLFFNMLCRLILMSILMFILIYLTSFTLTIIQNYIFYSFIIIQFILIVYSTYIILKCERLTHLARDKTKSMSVVK